MATKIKSLDRYIVLIQVISSTCTSIKYLAFGGMTLLSYLRINDVFFTLK